MEPTHGEYDQTAVAGSTELNERIRDAECLTDWRRILNDHISWGNAKVSDDTAIFNMNSATDCPNAKTQEEGESDTGLCQVGWDTCYAHKAENAYPNTLPYRRRQEMIWDHLDANTFARAFLEICDNKVTMGNTDEIDDIDLRFSESGDFRHRGDIVKADHIAELLEGHGITMYTYSASYKLDWSVVDTLVVQQSVPSADYGDRVFSAVEDVDDLPDDAVACPYSIQQQNGVPEEERTKCGDCRLCLNHAGPDVYVIEH